MTWGDWTGIVGGGGALAGVSVVVGGIKLADRNPTLKDNAAYPILVGMASLLCGVGVACLGELDPAVSATQAQIIAICTHSKAVDTLAIELYVNYLRDIGLYDLWTFVKNGTVPENFVQEAAARIGQ